MAIRLPRLRREIPIAEETRGPSLPFQQWIDVAFKQIETSVDNINLALAASGIALNQAGQALTVVIRSVSSSGPVLENDYILLVNASGGAVVLDLPAAADNTGAIVVVKKTDSSVNTVTIEGNASETVEGVASKVLSTQYDVTTLVCDGTAWWVIA